MHMSAAALPPIHGPVTEADKAHPRYPEYASYRRACDNLLVACAGFADWLRQDEAMAERDAWAEHPQYPAFLAWMRAEQGGARGNLKFPENFQFWLTGGRW